MHSVHILKWNVKLLFSIQVNDIILHACIVEANIDRSYEIKVSNTIVLILKALKYTMLHCVQYH